MDSGDASALFASLTRGTAPIFSRSRMSSDLVRGGILFLYIDAIHRRDFVGPVALLVFERATVLWKKAENYQSLSPYSTDR